MQSIDNTQKYTLLRCLLGVYDDAEKRMMLAMPLRLG